MKIERLHLEHFRSFERLSLDLSPRTTIFLGENGMGKTNVLESLAWLSRGVSFLGAELEDVVQWGHTHLRVRGEARRDDGESLTFEVVTQTEPRRQRASFINDVRMQASSYAGRLPVVSFLPWDLSLFVGSPSDRRRFLDVILTQYSPDARDAFASYDAALKQRNALLKNIVAGRASEADLDVWDRSLATSGARIRAERFALLEELEKGLSAMVISLGEKPAEDISLRAIFKGDMREEAAVQAELVSLLAQYRSRDLILQTTSVGPHRDDWRIAVGAHALASFGSRGQQRSYLLSLLFLSVDLLADRLNEKPIVLLDDVFSELDDVHQNALVAHLATYQVLLTTTHLPRVVPEDAQILGVSRGKIEPRVREAAVQGQ